MIDNIRDFKKESLKNNFFSSWNVISESEESITYQKIVPPSKPSCLIAFILLCILVIPGILYLVLAHHPQRIRMVTINKMDDELIPSGDFQGINMSKILINGTIEEVKNKEHNKKVIIISIIVVSVIIFIIMTSIGASTK